MTITELEGGQRDHVYAEQVKRQPGFGDDAQKTEAPHPDDPRAATHPPLTARLLVLGHGLTHRPWHGVHGSVPGSGCQLTS